MEKIDLNNYEAYFLDFMEGTLSAEEKHDLFAFLELHPELKDEMEDDFGVLELMPERVLFDGKESLKIDENELILTPNTVNDVMVASIEGQLSKEHNQQLEAYVKSHNLQKAFSYYKATILKPDTSIVYKEKQKLKAKTGVVISLPFITRVASIAAVGLILITLGVNFWSGPVHNNGVSTGNNIFATDVKNTSLLDLFQKRNDGTIDPVEDGLTRDSDSYRDQPDNNSLPNQFDNNDGNVAVIDERNDGNVQDKDTAVANPNYEIPSKVDLEELNNDEIAREDVEKKVFESPLVDESEPDLILASVKTEEPYKIVTNAASNMINRDIKFTRDRNLESNDYVAYSFKLGNFEFERKKSK